jgi:hypothetical protein
MSSPSINKEVLESVLRQQEMAMKAIYALALTLLTAMIVFVVERWDLATTTSAWLKKPEATKVRKKNQRAWRKPKKSTPWRRAKQNVPEGLQEYHVPVQQPECKEYIWERPEVDRPQEYEEKKKAPRSRVEDAGRVPPWHTREYKYEQARKYQQEKEWLRARLAHLLDGELDGVHVY